MSKTIEISRELAERLALPPKDNRGWTAWNSAVAYEAAKELRELLAAPVVERQDIQDWAIDHSAGRPILTLKGCSVIEAEDAAYVLSLVRRDQSPPAPVAVQAAEAFTKGFNLLEQKGGKYRITMDFQNSDDAFEAYRQLAELRKCLDKVKELNQ